MLIAKLLCQPILSESWSQISVRCLGETPVDAGPHIDQLDLPDGVDHPIAINVTRLKRRSQDHLLRVIIHLFMHLTRHHRHHHHYRRGEIVHPRISMWRQGLDAAYLPEDESIQEERYLASLVAYTGTKRFMQLGPSPLAT